MPKKSCGCSLSDGVVVVSGPDHCGRSDTVYAKRRCQASNSEVITEIRAAACIYHIHATMSPGHDGPDMKKFKPEASSSSSSPLPSSPRPQCFALRLPSLPDFVHDAIASFLTPHELHQIMGGDHLLLAIYGGRVKEVKLRPLHQLDMDTEPQAPHVPTIASLLKRRPLVRRVAVLDRVGKAGLAEAVVAGHCMHLRSLECGEVGDRDDGGAILDLCHALNGGACPRLERLVVTIRDHVHGALVIRALGEALQSRMRSGQGCVGLKSLVFRAAVEDGGHQCPSSAHFEFLSPVLQSGACDSLEELKLGGCVLGKKAQSALSRWLRSPKAAHLGAFQSMDKPSKAIISALASSPSRLKRPSVPGIARLRSLALGQLDLKTALHLSALVEGGGAWAAGLKELTMTLGKPGAGVLSRLLEAISTGAPHLTRLGLIGTVLGGGMGREGGQALGAWLEAGGGPCLEELDVTGGRLGDRGVAAIVRALEGGAACSGSLRTLKLGGCSLGPMGISELARAVKRGSGAAFPRLEALDLSDNYHQDNCAGLVHLFEAMKGGAFPQLRELDLEGTGMGESATALLEALTEHKACPGLVALRLGCLPDSMHVTERVRRLEASRAPRGRIKVAYSQSSSHGWWREGKRWPCWWMM